MLTVWVRSLHVLMVPAEPELETVQVKAVAAGYPEELSNIVAVNEPESPA